MYARPWWRTLPGVTRLPPVDPSEFSALQKKLYDEIAGPRGGAVGGPSSPRAPTNSATRKVGLDDAIIEAIRHGRTPTFTGGNDQLVYDFVKELCETRTVSDSTYQRATAALGTELLIELVTVIGFYTIAAMVIRYPPRGRKL